MSAFQNKISIITGAASGIGRETAILLAEEGSHLAISDINAEGLKKVEQICRTKGQNVSTHVVDVADRIAMQQFVVLNIFGGYAMLGLCTVRTWRWFDVVRE